MDPSNEEEYAEYFYELFTGHFSVAEAVNPLSALVEMRRLVDGGIDKELDKWTKEVTENG
jgi:hypothetical protein